MRVIKLPLSGYKPIVSHTAFANAVAAPGPFSVTIFPETTTSDFTLKSASAVLSLLPVS